MEVIEASESVMALGLPFDYIDKCIEDAKRRKNAADFADFHYYHRQGMPTICVVLHRSGLRLPINVLTEGEGQHMQTTLRESASRRR